MFARLGPWCHDRRRLVLGLWVGALVLGFVLSGAIGSAFRDEFNLPNVESKKGLDVLEDHFGGQGAGVVGTIVFRADQGVDDPAVETAMQGVFDKVAGLTDVIRVQSPYADEATSQAVGLVEALSGGVAGGGIGPRVAGSDVFDGRGAVVVDEDRVLVSADG